MCEKDCCGVGGRGAIEAMRCAHSCTDIVYRFLVRV